MTDLERPMWAAPRIELRTPATILATKFIAVLAAAMYAWIGVATGPTGCGGGMDSGGVVCMHARLCHQFGATTHDDATPVKSCCHASSAARHGGPSVEPTRDSCRCCAKSPGSSVASRFTIVMDKLTLVHSSVDSTSPHAVSTDQLVRLSSLTHGRPPPDPRGVVSLRARRACTGLLTSRLVI